MFLCNQCTINMLAPLFTLFIKNEHCSNRINNIHILDSSSCLRDECVNFVCCKSSKFAVRVHTIVLLIIMKSKLKALI